MTDNHAPAMKHLLTGTPCPFPDWCEECFTASVLTGNVYVTLPRTETQRP